MRFICSTALLVAALLIAIGSLGGCARLPETTSLGASTGSLAAVGASRALHGEIPGLPGRLRLDPPQAQAWGETRVSRLPESEAGGAQASILVARGDAAAVEPGRPTRTMIASELEARFPDVAMQIVTDPLYDAYGPFGLAVGSDAAGRTCAYAWQWIRDQPRFALAPGDAASVRIALCLPKRTPAEMAGLVKRLALKTGTPPQTPDKGPAPAAAVRGSVSPAAAAAAPPAPAAPVVAEGKLYLAPLAGAAPSRAEPAVSAGGGPAQAVPAGPIVPLPQAD